MHLFQRLALKYVRAKFRLLSSISKRKAAEKAFELFCTPPTRTRKKLSPFFQTAEKIEFPVEKEIVRGYRWNHPSSKKALILHGFESTVMNFEMYAEALVKKGYEVCAFDAPAHGHSTGKRLTAIAYKNMLEYAYLHYGPFQSFIAHSFGGLVLSMVLEETEHDRSYKAVLIAPATETKTAIDNFFRFVQLDGSIRPEFENIIQSMEGKPSSWYSIVRAAANIKAEVLFLQDEDDYTTPLSDVEPLIQKKYPNFRFVISKGLGHSRIYRDMQSFQTIMKFL